MNLRKVIASVSGSALVLAGISVSSPAHAATSCEVVYTANPWNEGPSSGGFTANLTVKNTGDAWSGWTLAFTLPSGQSVTLPGWSANWAQSGQNVTATPLDWNRNIGTNGSTGIGFNGRWSGSYTSPTSFSVNGVACNGQPPQNQPPTVSLTSPTAGQSFPSGTAVSLSATASDPDGTVDRVEFLIDGTVVGTDTTSPYSFSATGLSVGTHTAAARAVDTGNPPASAITPSVSFSVTGTQQAAIVATPASVSVPSGGTAGVNFRLNQAPSSSVTVAIARSGSTALSISPTSITFTSSNWQAGVNATITAAAGTAAASSTFTASATGYTSAAVSATRLGTGQRADNPYAGAGVYVNPQWRAQALAEPGGSRIANQPTGVWFDRISALDRKSVV